MHALKLKISYEISFSADKEWPALRLEFWPSGNNAARFAEPLRERRVRRTELPRPVTLLLHKDLLAPDESFFPLLSAIR